MENLYELKEGQLSVTVQNSGEQILVFWEGKSNERNPSSFLKPFFKRIFESSQSLKLPVVMDFKKFQYMNSSTVTPIVQMLESAKQENVSITFLYDRNKTWQELNFQAMKIFESDEPLIKIQDK